MNVKDRVLLESFAGEIVAPEHTEKHENYWALIGKMGTVVDDNASGNFVAYDGLARVLVQFDTSLDDLGLENHNQFENALWIQPSDLKQTT